METIQTANATDTAIPTLDEDAPVRIVVQTRTHLVPGKEYFERRDFMLNLICQRHWHRDMQFGPQSPDRWDLYRGLFGYRNRTCFFLVDHGTADDDDAVPVLRYYWTGEDLNPVKGDIPEKMRDRLKNDFPFTRPPQGPEKTIDDATKCRWIRDDLRSEMRPSHKAIEFLEKHPEHLDWLRDNIESRFWDKLEMYRRDNKRLQRQEIGPYQRKSDVTSS